MTHSLRFPTSPWLRALLTVFLAAVIEPIAFSQTAIILPDATALQTFSYKIHIAGGTPPFQFTVDQSSPLPGGLTLDKATGVIGGIPETGEAHPVSFHVDIQDSDSPPQRLKQFFTLKVSAAPMRVVAGPSPMKVVDAPPSESGSGAPDNSPADPAPPPPPQDPPPAKPVANAPAPNFTIAADALSKSVLLGKQVTYTITIAAQNGFTDQVTLASAGLPTGVTGSFSGSPVSSSGTATLTLSLSGTATIGSYPFTVTATSGDLSHTIALNLEVTPTGSLTRILIGVEQAGASSSSSTDKFFFDFYNSRPIGPASADSEPFGSPVRWWGNVRLGSTPVQTTAALSGVVSDLTKQAKALTLNQLAQAGEFQSGLEFRIHGTNAGPFTPIYHDKEWTQLGLILGGGATLPFNPQSSLSQVMTLPASGPARDQFNKVYPGSASTTASQVAFTTPDRNQFFRQWFTGFRLTSVFDDADSTNGLFRSVGTVSFTIGQNETVSGGRLRGLVAQAEGFYPIPISIGNTKLSAFYLFGRAAFQLTAAIQNTPLLLNPVSPQPTDLSSVLVVASPSRRDIYTIGIGVDALRFAKGLFAAATQTKTPAK